MSSEADIRLAGWASRSMQHARSRPARHSGNNLFFPFFHVKIGVIDSFLIHLALTQRFLAAAEASIVRHCVCDASFSFSPNPNLDR